MHTNTRLTVITEVILRQKSMNYFFFLVDSFPASELNKVMKTLVLSNLQKVLNDH